MNVLIDIVMVLFLAALIGNLFHWSGRRMERAIYHPVQGWLSTFLALWGGATGVATLLWLVRVVPFQVPGLFGLLYMITVQVYSLWFRWSQRHAVGRKAIA